MCSQAAESSFADDKLTLIKIKELLYSVALGYKVSKRGKGVIA